MFKNYPFVKQSESKDCGIACIQMIFKYYKGYVSKIKLEELTNVSKNGITAYNIIETFKYYDFISKGVKVTNLDHITLPCIAHVTIDKTYNHYVVIYEVNSKYIVIGDPMVSIKKIKKEEFNQIFNNIIITMSPTKKLPEYHNNESKLTFCFNIIKSYKKHIFHIILTSITITIITILNSFYFQYMIDSISNRNLAFLIFIFFIHFYLFNLLTNFIRNKELNILNKMFDSDVSGVVFKHIINLPYRFYSNRTSGDIISRISDMELIRLTFNKIILGVFIDSLSVIASFIMLYYISSKLAFISLIIFLMYVVLIIIFKPIIKKKVIEYQELKAKSTSSIIEAVSNYETVKGLNIEANTLNSVFKKYLNVVKSVFDTNNILNYQESIKNSLSEILFLLITYFGIIEVSNNNLTIGSLLTFNIVINYFLNPIKNLMDINNNIISSKNALNRIIDIFYKEEETGVIKNTFNGNIEINNLFFSYNYNEILKNISFNIKKNEKVLIMGSSGCGKSTILKIIKKYYEIKRGMILIDKIDINDYTKEAINNNIVYVAQKENLFTDTLYNNIVLNRNISNQEFQKIVKICEIDFLNNLGFNMLIEENGFNLSGGQRQRIVLARALLSKANTILLDESTSEIDTNLERIILKNVFKNFNNKTIIIVTHRKDNMDLFNKVIRINKDKLEVLEKNA